MYAWLGPRETQSLKNILERKLPPADNPPEEDFVINEHTIALFHLYVAYSLDSRVAMKRGKMSVYDTQFYARYNSDDVGPIQRRSQLETRACRIARTVASFL